MKKIIILISLAVFAVGAACGGRTETASGNKTNNSNADNKSTASTADNKSAGAATPASTAAGSPSATVKDVYGFAMKRDGKSILPLLTEDFRKAVGTSSDAMDALCDTFTDSGKITNAEVKEEKVTGDSATVKVALTYKDGKKEDKEENAKKVDGKWLMDS